MSSKNSDVIEMDEVSFLHKLNQNPLSLDDKMMDFLENNPEKLATVEEAKAFDQQLIELLTVDPPEGLADKIIVRNGFSTKAANDNNWFSSLSMVAASFLVVVVGFWAWQSNERSLLPVAEPSQYAEVSPQMNHKMLQHILEHTVEEATTMPASQLAVNDVNLQRVFDFVGATLHKSIDSMSYAGQCDVDGKLGLHVVIQEKTGPVTVIVMPGEKLAVIESFKLNGYVGNIIPVRGAVVAIIGKTDVEVAMAQMHFFKAVKFS